MQEDKAHGTQSCAEENPDFHTDFFLIPTTSTPFISLSLYLIPRDHKVYRLQLKMSQHARTVSHMLFLRPYGSQK